MWLLPAFIVVLSIALSYPLGRYMAWVFDRPANNTLERWLDTGEQDWKRYCFSLLGFNSVAFAFGFVVLAMQQYLPLNPDDKPALAPTTIFNTVISFITNTNLQHYSGEQHLSYFSQLVFVCWNQFVSPCVGLGALLAVIRGFRGDAHLGNFYLDLWRGTFHVMLPLSFVMSLLLLLGGSTMTLEGAAKVTTLEGNEQIITRGPVAAIVAIKQVGANGGGYFGANSAHPFENPSAFTNIIECLCILLIPMACVVMFGELLANEKRATTLAPTGQAFVIFSVMLLILVAMITWCIATDTLAPNPGLAGLPLDQSAGNLEGKELRFGPSAGATWVGCTTAVSHGSVNCMHDSLNPLASLTAFAGMWLNCVFGSIGVGLINFFVYLIVAVFLSGLMVGRTPEYLGKKVEAREMKLAMLALLIHPLLILAPTAVAAVSDWGTGATSNPGPHGLSQILYEFSSASANNGSGFEGLSDTIGSNPSLSDTTDLEKATPIRRAVIWDIATGLVILVCRFLPIIAPIALAGSLAKKKPTPFTAGSLRTDTVTFGVVLVGTILLVGALLFLPVAALGPIAEHLSMKG